MYLLFHFLSLGYSAGVEESPLFRGGGGGGGGGGWSVARLIQGMTCLSVQSTPACQSREVWGHAPRKF